MMIVLLTRGARKRDARVVTPLSDSDGSTDFDLCALPGSLGLEVGRNERGELAVVRVLATSQFINNVKYHFWPYTPYIFIRQLIVYNMHDFVW